MSECVRACVRAACVRACMRACVLACVRACVCVETLFSAKHACMMRVKVDILGQTCLHSESKGRHFRPKCLYGDSKGRRYFQPNILAL